MPVVVTARSKTNPYPDIRHHTLAAGIETTETLDVTGLTSIGRVTWVIDPDDDAAGLGSVTFDGLTVTFVIGGANPPTSEVSFLLVEGEA